MYFTPEDPVARLARLSSNQEYYQAFKDHLVKQKDHMKYLKARDVDWLDDQKRAFDRSRNTEKPLSKQDEPSLTAAERNK